MPSVSLKDTFSNVIIISGASSTFSLHNFLSLGIILFQIKINLLVGARRLVALTLMESPLHRHLQQPPLTSRQKKAVLTAQTIGWSQTQESSSGSALDIWMAELMKWRPNTQGEKRRNILKVIWQQRNYFQYQSLRRMPPHHGV